MHPRERATGGLRGRGRPPPLTQGHAVTQPGKPGRGASLEPRFFAIRSPVLRRTRRCAVYEYEYESESRGWEAPRLVRHDRGTGWTSQPHGGSGSEATNPPRGPAPHTGTLRNPPFVTVYMQAPPYPARGSGRASRWSAAWGKAVGERRGRAGPHPHTGMPLHSRP